jgi:hypothetical protein
LAVLVGMYHGIEIGHPVFAVLFADLVTIWCISFGRNLRTKLNLFILSL